MAKAIPDFEPFIVYGNDTSSSSIATRWKKWLQRFNNLMVAMDISAKKRERALLIHLAGSQVYDIFDTFTAEQKGSEDDFDTAVKSLTTYFEPKKNTEYEIYKFRQASQRHDEKLDSYHTCL
jgi:arabinogalactan endo-1,4-beta-galactosidase